MSCVSCVGRQIVYHCATWEPVLNVAGGMRKRHREHRFPFGGCQGLSSCESLAKNGICHHLSATKRHLKVVRATVVWFPQRKYLFKYLKVLSAYLKQFRIVYSIK